MRDSNLCVKLASIESSLKLTPDALRVLEQESSRLVHIVQTYDPNFLTKLLILILIF